MIHNANRMDWRWCVKQLHSMSTTTHYLQGDCILVLTYILERYTNNISIVYWEEDGKYTWTCQHHNILNHNFLRKNNVVYRIRLARAGHGSTKTDYLLR